LISAKNYFIPGINDAGIETGSTATVPITCNGPTVKKNKHVLQTAAQ
jgi:hypothetical protein